MMGDIKKMYNQVRVGKTPSTQNILLREEEENPIDIYQLNTVTFRTTPAAFMATRALKGTSKYKADLNVKNYIEKCFTLTIYYTPMIPETIQKQ
jgi:hypothetical protein